MSNDNLNTIANHLAEVIRERDAALTEVNYLRAQLGVTPAYPVGGGNGLPVHMKTVDVVPKGSIEVETSSSTIPAMRKAVKKRRKVNKKTDINEALKAAGIKKPNHFGPKQKWFKEFSQTCAHENPHWTSAQIRDIGKQIWNNMDNDEKAPWKAEFDAELLLYNQMREETIQLLIEEPKKGEFNHPCDVSEANTDYQSCCDLDSDSE